ncbi:MAG TPA: SemiSWEET family transporter [Bacteroidia bacterium]
MDFTLIIGIAASIFTGIFLLPQLTKLIREKKAENISVGAIIILLIGLIGWIWYGVLKKDYIIIISNSFSMLINIITLYFSMRYKKQISQVRDLNNTGKSNK